MLLDEKLAWEVRDMYVMVTVIQPGHKMAEINEVFQKAEQTPFPPFIKRLYLFGRPDSECGVKAWIIYEIDAGKEFEGLQVIWQRYGQYLSIEGYKFDVDVVAEQIRETGWAGGQTS